MVQGDAYNIDVAIKVAGAVLNLEEIETVEIALANIVKMYPAGEVTYVDGLFHYPLTQTESQALPPTCPMQVRVKFISGDVIGSPIQWIDVKQALSKAVL